MPHVENVPGRTAVEVHFGNWPRNTDACLLVGQDYGHPTIPDFISHSDVSWDALMAELYAGSTLTNPGVSEQEEIWDCGTIEYLNAVVVNGTS